MVRPSSLARLTLVAVLLAGAGGAACGGGGGSTDDSAVGTTVPAGPTTTPQGDQALVESVNLKLTDLPLEWKSTPLAAGAAADNQASQDAYAKCVGRPPPASVRTADADSLDFSALDTRRASSNVETVQTEAIAKGDFAALRADIAVSCQKAQVDAEFARQLPAADTPTTTIDRLNVGQYGDDTVAFRVIATSLAQGQTVTTYLDLVAVRKGRVEISAGFINRSAAFPADLEKTLLQTLVGRA
jgi:hypothetical protein